MRFREKGSSGGHRGMQSIIDNSESEDLNRLKIGIGKDKDFPQLSEYVLSDFSLEEKKVLKSVILRAASAACDWVLKGTDYVMAHYNKRGN